jgi:hypothetical protein
MSSAPLKEYFALAFFRQVAINHMVILSVNQIIVLATHFCGNEHGL